jgi:hypothetical protein
VDPQDFDTMGAARGQAHFAERPAYSEIELARRFAEQFGDEFLYVTATGQWYRRELDSAKQPYWARDDTLWIITSIKFTLRRVAAEAPRGIARKLGAAATVAAVEWLARPHFAGTAEDLEPGELARQEVRGEALLAALRAPTAAPQAQPAPTPPLPPPTYPAPPEPPAGGQHSATEELARFIAESAAWRDQQKPPS